VGAAGAPTPRAAGVWRAVHLRAAMVSRGSRACASGAAPRDRTTAPDAPTDAAWRRLLVVGAAGILVTITLGAIVHDEYVGGWPLVDGRLVPEFTNAVVAVHYAHRVLAALTFALLVWLAVAAVRRMRPRHEVLLVHGSAALFAVNIGVGAAHVFTRVESTTLVVVHILVASLTWTALVAAASLAHRSHSTEVAEPRIAPALDAAEATP
jgi:heme A synthase